MREPAPVEANKASSILDSVTMSAIVDAMRRSAIVLALAAVTVLACGSDHNNPPGTSSGGSGGAGASGGSSMSTGGSGAPGAFGDPMEVIVEVGPTGSHYLQSRVHGDTLAVCSGRYGFKTHDISDPASLKELSTLTFTLGQRCEYMSIDGPANIAFVSHAQEQSNPQSFVAAVDLSNPASPKQIGILPLDQQPAGLDFIGSLVVVAAKADGLLLFDFDGSTFSPAGSVPMSEAFNVRFVDKLAYVANGSAGLTIVDFSDAKAPKVRGSVALDGIAKDLVITEDRAYVAVGGDGVATVDVSTPDAPKLLDIDQTPGSATAIAVSPNVNGLFVADWNDIRVFDISDRDNPAPLGREPLELKQGNKESRSMGIASDGEFVYGSNWDILASYRFVPGVSAPDLVISPATLMLTDTGQGETTVAAVLLANDGPHPLENISVTAGNGLTVDVVPDTIAPFATGFMEVSFTATSAQPLATTLSISSNDIDQPTQTMSVFANQAGLGVGDAGPDWTYFDLDQNTVALSDYANQVVMLAYFSTF